MAATRLGSILLGSADPERLSAWYRAAFEPTRLPSGFLDFGGFDVLVDGRDDVAGTTAEPGRVILNFEVTDARAVAAHLDGLGVTWVAPLDERPDGLFGTLLDPDGNYVQIIELNEAYHAAARGGSGMLAGSPAFNGFSVDDIAVAETFYRDTLGIAVTKDHGMLHLRLGGNREILVYLKPDHEPATYTMLNFPVDDILAAVAWLRERGVELEKFDGVDDNGVFRRGGPPIAWFRDPAGNILSVIEE
jgi:catechol 2,3-dioxygenase-like lactoylglutathione lyase family enzyme